MAARNTNLVEDVEVLLPVAFRFAVSENSKMFRQIKDQGGHLGFLIGLKTQT